MSDPPCALVTGAAGSIGRAIVDRLVADGFTVLASDRVEEMGTSLGRRVRYRSIDLLNPGAASELVDAALVEFGRLDLVVNNAAVIAQKTIDTHSRHDIDTILAVNVRAPFEIIQQAVQHLERSAIGLVVNVVSLAAFRYTGPHLAYTAAKSALVGLTRDAACELAPRGVRVVGVAPGPTQSAMLDGVRSDRLAAMTRATPLGSLNEPESVADVVALLAAPEARRLTGVIVPVAGGLELTVGVFGASKE